MADFMDNPYPYEGDAQTGGNTRLLFAEQDDNRTRKGKGSDTPGTLVTVAQSAQSSVQYEGALSATPTSPAPSANDFWFNTTTNRWAWNDGTDTIDVDTEAKMTAMNTAISTANGSSVYSLNNLGVWASTAQLREALDAGSITFRALHLYALTDDTVRSTSSYTPSLVQNDELPGGIHPVVRKATYDDDVRIFGKLISVTPDGTECTVAVKGRNIVFASNGDTDAVADAMIGRGIYPSGDTGQVTYGSTRALTTNAHDRGVGTVVGGTNDNIRVDLR